MVQMKPHQSPNTFSRKHQATGVYCLWIIIVAAVLARIVYAATYEHLYDDTFTTLRYAQNLAEGNGYVFNKGERVYGASSPLYTLVMAGSSFIVPRDEMAAIACWFGVACLVGFVLLMWKFLPLPLHVKPLLAAFLLGYPRIFYWSVTGMEETFILLLAGMMFTALVRRSEVMLGLACALLFVAKLDTVVWIAGGLVGYWAHSGKFPWKSVAYTFVFSVPWIVYATLEFGSIIPHTIVAKQVAYSCILPSRLMDTFLLPVPEAFKGNIWIGIFFAVFAYGSMLSSGWIVVKKREWLMIVFPFYSLVYVALLALSGTALRLWEWWTVPLWGAVLICFSHVISHVAVVRHFLPRKGSFTAFASGAVVILFVLFVLVFEYQNRTDFTLTSERKVAEWLHYHAGRSESVLLEPIGYIGYNSGLYEYDFIGLVSPEVTFLRQMTPGSNRWFVQLLKHRNPTYVVLRSKEFIGNEFLYAGCQDSVFQAQERTWFAQQYTQVLDTGGLTDKEHLLLFRRISMDATALNGMRNVNR